MTSVFGADGKNIPCTVIEAGPCVVTQLKTPEKDGYSAVQIAYDETTEKHTSNSLLGHFKKANTTPKRKLVEFTSFENELNLGDVITVDIFEENDWVDVTGISKGKGFQGRRTASTTVSASRVRWVPLRIRRACSKANAFRAVPAESALRCSTCVSLRNFPKTTCFW